MTPLPLRARTDQSALTGRHVVYVLFTFFGVVFAVNGYFLYAALSTHTGIVAVEPYRKGLAYNVRIAADERQRQLGWLTDVNASAGGKISLSMRDHAGLPVVGQQVTAALGRPSTDRFDRKLDLRETEPGLYTAEWAALQPGSWLAQIEVRSARGDDPIYRLRRHLWLAP
jgi:nitrogen fixation protein FixH